MCSYLDEFSICNTISDNIKQNIILFHVFETDYESNVLYVTSDDLVYGLGYNYYGCLGLGHNHMVTSPQIIPQLCHQRIQRFINGFSFVLAVTAENHIYIWGQNSWGQLGVTTPETDVYIKPQKLAFFDDKDILEISCGLNHCLILSSDGQVYGWGRNSEGQVWGPLREAYCGPMKLDLYIVGVITRTIGWDVVITQYESHNSLKT
ncbi:unnamed protein product [Oppiella nova]|uniref:Uncharacterized protein n=1 Tax=Oppiella nova TaxID=334625 RepID=A0A7R9LKP5_9ACAR|nr:unnamed protein product [Oppiella nova]CAG2164601.1 unnamed protein product [Oppiella nova]